MTIPILPGVRMERWWIVNGYNRLVYPAPFGVPEWIMAYELGVRAYNHLMYPADYEDEDEG